MILHYYAWPSLHDSACGTCFMLSNVVHYLRIILQESYDRYMDDISITTFGFFTSATMNCMYEHSRDITFCQFLFQRFYKIIDGEVIKISLWFFWRIQPFLWTLFISLSDQELHDSVKARFQSFLLNFSYIKDTSLVVTRRTAYSEIIFSHRNHIIFHLSALDISGWSTIYLTTFAD